MLASAGRVAMWSCGLIIILAITLLAIDGAVSTAAAVDRWVGTAVLNGIALNFTVLVNPGDGASWEWRYRGTLLAGGPLAAFVSGPQVNGTLYTTGGAVASANCCSPCNFSGTIAGNRVDGSLDPITCGGGGGTFTLIKQ
jgi:hypothetical protein